MIFQQYYNQNLIIPCAYAAFLHSVPITAVCQCQYNMKHSPCVLIVYWLILCYLNIQINALRVAINRLVCEGPSGTLHLGPDRISHLQDDCRERLTRSLTYSHRNLC